MRRFFLAVAFVLLPSFSVTVAAGTYIRPISANLLTSGLTGTLAYTVYAADNTTVLVARTTAGVTEDGTTAIYTASVANWNEAWVGSIRWDAGAGTLARETFGANFSASIQAKTTNLPASPAATGDAMAISPGQTVAGVTGNVSGNVTGSVASVTGAVGSVSAPVVSTSVTNPVTVGTNNDKAGYSLATAPPTLAQIVSGVWDETQAGHVTANTFGAYLNGSISGITTSFPSATAVATAVWQDLTSGSDFTTPNSIGSLLKGFPANFTSSTFASPGVFAANALQNVPSGQGQGGSSIPIGTVVVGSTVGNVIVAGLGSGRNFVGQHLWHQSGESRLIGSQAMSGSNYVFTFQPTALLPSSFSAIAVGDSVKPTP